MRNRFSGEYINIILALGFILCGPTLEGTASLPGAADTSSLAIVEPVIEQFIQSPAMFIENRGQWADETVRFALSGAGVNVGFTDAGPRFQLFGKQTVSTRMAELALRFEGAHTVIPEGNGLSEQVFHHHRGEPAQWRENVPSWVAVAYRGLYNGIDLLITGTRSGIKYDFMLAPGADWRQIRLRYDGIERMVLRADGSLEIHPDPDRPPLLDSAPYIYQDMDGRRVSVEGRFALVDTTTYGFEITGAYDPTWPLVIDPSVEWSTYLGGSETDSAAGIAVDASGAVYVTGKTRSASWVSDGWNPNYNDRDDAYVVKLTAAGGHVWSTYLGGNETDSGTGIAVDDSGAVYVTGKTLSSGWVSGGWNPTYGGSLGDGYVVKLTADGNHAWSTYLGGNGIDEGTGIAVDVSGAVYATGKTGSSGWVSGGFNTTQNGFGGDAYVVKLTAAGEHVWSTYLGGDNDDRGDGIAVDDTGAVYVSGSTYSAAWVSDGFDISHNGGWDAFVAKLTAAGNHTWSTYLGGSGEDQGLGIAVDVTGAVYVTGITASSDWISGGWDSTLDGLKDAFVVKLTAAGGHSWSTYLGGGDNDEGTDIAADDMGALYVTGETNSTGWMSGGFDMNIEDFRDGFVVKLTMAGDHVWSSYLGGNRNDEGTGIAVDGTGVPYVTGQTSSFGWATGGWDPSLNGSSDAFVVKIREGAQGDGEGEGLSEGEGQGEGEGEGEEQPPCVYAGAFNTPVTGQGPVVANGLDSMSTELASLLVSVGMGDWFDWDIEYLEEVPGIRPIPGDNLEDSWQIALVEYALCHPSFRTDLGIAADFRFNRDLFAEDCKLLHGIDYSFGSLPDVAGRLIPAMIGTSTTMKNTVNEVFLVLTGGITGLPSIEGYRVFGVAKAPSEPFSANGDLDNDGLTNLEEAAQVRAAGGGMELFVLAATNPVNLWPDNPAVPAGSMVGLCLLVGAIAFGGARIVRKK